MGQLELLTIMNYRSKKYVEHGNVEAYAVSEYTRWDLRANWESANSPFKVTAYVQNALDQAALHMWSPREGLGSPFGTIVEPREIGIQIGWEFE
ncbi:MAG: TonB-dependent receptor [Gammaproteobacteria bacterium]|nr:TonB-dependent receptor [Gammaproteobacteria bacterium]